MSEKEAWLIFVLAFDGDGADTERVVIKPEPRISDQAATKLWMVLGNNSKRFHK
jgi:hypothetical protein